MPTNWGPGRGVAATSSPHYLMPSDNTGGMPSAHSEAPVRFGLALKRPHLSAVTSYRRRQKSPVAPDGDPPETPSAAPQTEVAIHRRLVRRRFMAAGRRRVASSAHEVAIVTTIGSPTIQQQLISSDTPFNQTPTLGAQSTSSLSFSLSLVTRRPPLQAPHLLTTKASFPNSSHSAYVPAPYTQDVFKVSHYNYRLT